MARIVQVGDAQFEIVTSAQGGQWTAEARRVDSGDRFGPSFIAPGEQEAASRLEAWLAWQREHVQALAALQDAERAYHRTIAGSAFVSPTEGPSALELQKEALRRLEDARLRLDHIRRRMPEA